MSAGGPTWLFKCETCGDTLPGVACKGCADRDYRDLRHFQASFIAADRERRRRLAREVVTLRIRLRFANLLRAETENRRARLEAFRSWVSLTILPKAKIQRMARAMRGRG